MSNVTLWRSRLESTANELRHAAGKAVRTVSAEAVVKQVLRTYSQEASSLDAPHLLDQAVMQLLEGDWRAQPKRKSSWKVTWRGLRLPNLFVYARAVTPLKMESEIAWHPWLSKRITGPLSSPVRVRLQQLNAYLFMQSGGGQTLFPGQLGHRERSLLIFNDEKALETMPACGWKHAALTLAEIGAFRRAPPLPYKSSGRSDLPAVIVENSDVYYRLCQVNKMNTRWSLVVYGAGNKVSGQAECLSQLLEDEQVNEVFYFGDLDIAGLKIAHQLHRKLLDGYGINLHLDEWLYKQLIHNNRVTVEGSANNEKFDFESLCSWMPCFVLREMKALITAHQRLPQEGIALLTL